MAHEISDRNKTVDQAESHLTEGNSTDMMPRGMQ